MVVSAIDEIKNGEEILWSYTDAMDAHSVRRRRLYPYGILCGCRLCELDRADGDEVCDERARLAKQALSREWNPSQYEMMRLVDQVWR